MKKIIVVSAIMTLMLLAGSSFALAQLQDSAKEEKPTFYRLTPGVYVNGWPRFTVHYPKDWVEETPLPQEVFRAGTVDPTLGEKFIVAVHPHPLPLDKYADTSLLFWRAIATDVTVVSDTPSRLMDGTPAREVEIKMIRNGEPFNSLSVAMKKGDRWYIVNVGSFKGKIGEDLKAIPYSLQYEMENDEPVKVPPDVQEFLDRCDNDILSHDVAKVMANYSDRYLNSGTRKGEMERFWRQMIGFWISLKGTITDFVPAGDRAYLTGFVIGNFAKPPVTETAKIPITDTSIIKENGEWKWYGNQRDVSP